MIEEYLSRGGGGDRLGDFIQWLYRRVTVYGHILGGEWWDIGSFESYYKAIESLCKRRSQQRSG